MKRIFASIVAVLLAFGLLVFQPKLFLIAAIGSVLGAGVAILVVYLWHSRNRANARITTAALLGLLLAISATVIVVSLNSGGSESSDVVNIRLNPHELPDLESPPGGPAPEEGPSEGGLPPYHRLGKSIRAISYEGDFVYEDGPKWHLKETVRVARAQIAQMVAGKSLESATSRRPVRKSAESKLVHNALGPEWIYLGDRSGGKALAYRRTRDLPIDVPFWPPMNEETVRIGTIHSSTLAVTLVPSNGSTIRMHAPANLVKETDPPAEKQQFGDEDILTMELDGLEDDANRRALHLHIAGWIGRSSIYGALEDLTAWTIVKLLFAGVPGTLVAFFLTRRLKRRFPDQPGSVQPA